MAANARMGVCYNHAGLCGSSAAAAAFCKVMQTMRLAILSLSAAGMLAGCEPAEPRPAASPVAPQPAAALGGPAGPAPEIDFTPGDREQGDSPGARQQAEASIRDLERSAATLPSDIAGVRRRAEEAVRNAAPPAPPAAPEPARVPPPAPAAPAPAPAPPAPVAPPAAPGA